MPYQFDPLTGSVSLSGGGGGLTDVNGPMSGSVIPDTNSQYDLGSAEFKIRHLYLSDNSIYTTGGTLSIGDADDLDPPSTKQRPVKGTDFKTLVQQSVDFADFKARIDAATEF